MEAKITIEQLAEKLGKSVWTKGEMKRIYMNDAGWNTKKMSTKAYIGQNSEIGELFVWCKVECPQQSEKWIEQQEKEVRDRIYDNISRAIFNINNPNYDYDEYQESLQEKREESARKAVEKKIIDEEKVQLDKEIESVRRQLNYLEQALAGNDPYSPKIPIISRIYSAKNKPANSNNFLEEMPEMCIINGIIENGERKKIQFPQIKVEWTFNRKCGNGQKNREFIPVELPKEIKEALYNALKEAEIAKKEYIKKSLIFYNDKLKKLLEK